MCILRDPVISVGGTRIFTLPSLDRERQLTVYSNTVETERLNMMILPVPYPETFAFEEVVMEYQELFRDAADSLYVDRGEGSYAWWRSAAAGAHAPLLPVYTVGPYLASIAYSIADLDRLDTASFSPLAPNLREMLHATYAAYTGGTPFGFLCCRLLPGPATAYRPLAYSHAALEGVLFVPTKHWHAGWDAAPPAVADDWDHLIYSFGTEQAYAHVDSEPGVHYIPLLRNRVGWHRLPPAYRYSPSAPIRCWRKKGLYMNKDLIFPFEMQDEEQEDPRPRRPSTPHRGDYASSLPGLRGAFF